MDYKINYFLNLGWNFNDYHRIGLTVIGSNLNNAGSGDGNGASSLNFPYRGKPYYDEQTKKLTNISLTYEGKTADGSKEWLARYFAGKSDYDTYQRFGELEPGNPSEFTSTFGKNDFQGAQAQFAWDFDIVKIVTGVDWLQYKVTQTQPVIPSQPSTRKNDTQSKYTNIGVFLLGRLRLLAERNLVFSFGVRHDETDVDIQLERTNYSRHDKRKFSKTIPSAGLSYSPLDYLKFRLNYGQAFVTPTPRNLVGNFYMGSTLFLGNPNLEPEKSATWEGGFDIDYEGVTSSFTYFYTKYDNYIGTLARQTIDGQTGTLYINIKDVTISGFEASFAVDFGRLLGWEFKLEPYVNWTHLEKFEDSIGRKLPSLNQDAASFGVDFNYPKFDLSAGLSATYYGRPDSTSFSSGTKPAQRGGAMVYDLSLTKGLINFTDNQGISLKVSVRNMFNKEYDIINNLDQPGRNFYIALVYNYK
ncbi:MAG: TonB-dependent receptor [Deltaproteobacteria bacterium]|nr:TonB-dependent receptor [Deltaproteobacteria bacterium]